MAHDPASDPFGSLPLRYGDERDRLAPTEVGDWLLYRRSMIAEDAERPVGNATIVWKPAQAAVTPM